MGRRKIWRRGVWVSIVLAVGFAIFIATSSRHVVVQEGPVQLFSWWARLDGYGASTSSDLLAGSGLTILKRPFVLFDEFWVCVRDGSPAICIVDFREADEGRRRRAAQMREENIEVFSDVYYYLDGESPDLNSREEFRRIGSFSDLLKAVQNEDIPPPSWAKVCSIRGTKFRDLAWHRDGTEATWICFRNDDVIVRSDKSR